MKEEIPFILPQIEEAKDLCSLCKYILTDLDSAKILQRIFRDPAVYNEIALARLREFGEISTFHKSICNMTAERNANITADMT